MFGLLNPFAYNPYGNTAMSAKEINELNPEILAQMEKQQKENQRMQLLGGIGSQMLMGNNMMMAGNPMELGGNMMPMGGGLNLDPRMLGLLFQMQG
jgi:hypothetical protein